MSIVKELGIEDAVKNVKDNGCLVECAEIDDKKFVYRSLNRMEWKVIQKDTLKRATSPDGSIDNTRALEVKDDTEEIVVVKGLLYPSLSDVTELTGYPAGYISLLAEKITVLSGFGDGDIETTRL